MTTILLNSDAGGGGGSVPHDSEDPQAEPKLPVPPPAAATVAAATKSERELKLEADLESERGRLKAHEQRINQLEDDNRRLKEIPATAPTPPKKESSGFRWTFFEDED